MFTLMIATVALTVLTGLLWHNQPARGPEGTQRKGPESSHE